MSSQIVIAQTLKSCVEYDAKRTLIGFKQVVLTWKDPFIQRELWPEYARLANNILQTSKLERVRSFVVTPDLSGMTWLMNHTVEYEFSYFKQSDYHNGVRINDRLSYRDVEGHDSNWAVLEWEDVLGLYGKIACANSEDPKIPFQQQPIQPVQITQQPAKAADTIVVKVVVDMQQTTTATVIEEEEYIPQNEPDYDTFGYDNNGREIRYNNFDEQLYFYNPRINDYIVMPYSYVINWGFFPTWNDYSCGNRQPIRDCFPKFHEEHPRREHHERQPEETGGPAGVPGHDGSPAGTGGHSADTGSPDGAGGFPADDNQGSPSGSQGHTGDPAGAGGFSADNGSNSLKSANTNTRAQSNTNASNRRMTSSNTRVATENNTSGNRRVNSNNSNSTKSASTGTNRVNSSTRINSNNTGNNTRRVNSSNSSNVSMVNSATNRTSVNSSNSRVNSQSRFNSTPSRNNSSSNRTAVASNRSSSPSGGGQNRSLNSNGGSSIRR